MAAFVAVVWTTGDVITETKLDNMVSNSQSEDAHAANGMIMNNNVPYSAEQADTTKVDVMKLGTDDLLRLSQFEQQLNTSDSVIENVLLRHGYGFMVPNTQADILEVVTFATAYSSAPIVLCTSIGRDTGGGSSAITDFTDYTSDVHGGTEDITTANFKAHLSTGDGSNFGDGTAEFGYAWFALGVKA